jgi:hypothetical protein
MCLGTIKLSTVACFMLPWWASPKAMHSCCRSPTPFFRTLVFDCILNTYTEQASLKPFHFDTSSIDFQENAHHSYFSFFLRQTQSMYQKEARTNIKHLAIEAEMD